MPQGSVYCSQRAGFLPLSRWTYPANICARAAEIAGSFPRVAVHAVAMDFLGGMDRIKPILPSAGRRLILFSAGSSIGNFDPPDARRLLPVSMTSCTKATAC